MDFIIDMFYKKTETQTGDRFVLTIYPKVNPEEGEMWLRKAAEAQEPVAMRVLGYRLLVGQGLEQNIEEGEKWLQKAAEAGEVIAMREWETI